MRKAGLKAVPTGIAHGTVTVIADGVPFEVTTLRRDVATGWVLGRQAVDPVAPTDGLIDVGFLDGGEPARPALIEASDTIRDHPSTPSHTTAFRRTTALTRTEGRLLARPEGGQPFCRTATALPADQYLPFMAR